MAGTKREVLIVDDVAAVVGVHARYAEEAGYLPRIATSMAEALWSLEQYPGIELLLLNLKMPGVDGFGVLKELRSRYPDTGIVIVTEFDHIPSVVRTIKMGVFNYLLKPLTREGFREVVDGYFSAIPTAQRCDARFSRFITGDPKVILLFDRIRMFGGADVTVLIQGESGTGKALVAELLHAFGPRPDGPFVAVDIASVSPTHFEIDLFGSGARWHRDGERRGLFEAANGGTLFLDDIGDLDLEGQKRLLRVMQTKRFVPVGLSKERELDARIVLATNKNLFGGAGRCDFREDLYFRISGHTIDVPPLRERGGDVELLARHFLRAC